MNQNQKVLNHLIDHGYITQVVASSYGIRRCTSRITDLKNEGITVSSELRRDDQGVPYAYYTMTDADRNYERMRRAEGFGWKRDSLLKAA